MLLRITTLITFFWTAQSVFGQSGTVTVHKDSRIDQRIADMGVVVPPNPTPQIDGYRIQLAFGQSKHDIEAARAKFNLQYPQVDTYIIYKAPNFFLKAGDFRSSIEAEKVKASVESDFPTSTIVKEKINLPRIAE